MRIIGDLLVESSNDFIDIPLTQAVLIAILHEVMAGIDHKDTSTLIRIFLVNDNDASRDTGAIEQIGRQTNDALDIACFDQILTNSSLCIATEQNTVGQNNRSLTGALQRFQNMHQPGIVTVLFRRSFTIAIKSAVFLNSIRPVFDRERRVSNDIVKSAQHSLIRSIFKILRVREGIAGHNGACCPTMQNSIHFCKTGSGSIFFLTITGKSDRCFIQRTDQQRTGAAGGVYVPADFDTIEKAFFGVKTAEEGIK